MTANKIILLSCLYVFSLPAFSQNYTTAKTYALVIGIAGYENKTIPALQYADKDARLFAEWLQSKAGGSVPDYQIKLLTNENAHLAAVYNGFDWLKQSASKGDTIFIYFSGHGDIETKDSLSQGYLLVWNSPANNYRNNAVSVNDLNNMANSITTLNKASVVLITDACHSGKMAGDFYKGKQFTASNLQLVLNNQVRLASCRADERAAEGPFWGGGRGVFSYYLLKGLNGKAGKEGRVKLKELQTYLDTSLASDKYLKLDNHQQHPVSDGSPLFTMAIVDTTLKTSIENEESLSVTDNKVGLQSLKKIGRKPIDYFFEIANGPLLDSLLPFASYNQQPVNEVPSILLKDYITHLQSIAYKIDSLTKLENNYISTPHSNKEDKDSLSLLIKKINQQAAYYQQQLNAVALDTLQMLQNQLQVNKYTRERFIEKFVQLTHQKSQDMINAYLKGDLAELEKRQYYYAGSRDYRSFLPVMSTAIHLVPTSNYLHNILRINQTYISGLIDRFDITLRQEKSDSLLSAAIAKQEQALLLEPYAAYIHNELGNLYLQKRQFNKAASYFDFALTLSPTWAIPWSNKIRLNFAQNQLTKAKEAIHIADSLQPNLAYVLVNAGLVMEKENNLLAAEGYYLSSIAQNDVHYLPYERLGKIYIQTGDYQKADSFLFETSQRKDAFAVNQAVFDFGIELGGKPLGGRADFTLVNCKESKDISSKEWENYNTLYDAILKLKFSTDSNSIGKKLAREILQKEPDIVLASHYLGKKYFEEGNWQLAVLALKQAKANYLYDEELRVNLKQTLKNLLLTAYSRDSTDKNKIFATSAQYAQLKLTLEQDAAGSCLLNRIVNLNYDAVEDNYMLAHIYAQKGLWEEAIAEYKIIIGIENIKQMEQAVLKDFQLYRDMFDVTKTFKGTDVEYEKLNLEYAELIDKYNNPFRMGGTLKLASIYKNLGRYELAEEVLLKQITLNQQAGYARQEQMNNGNFGPSGRSTINYYWLDVNKDLEIATYNFYNNMIEQFPRDAYWYKKAGMFLYNRLSLTYKQIPYAERVSFYNYSNEYAYPYEGSVDGKNKFLDDSGRIVIKQNHFELPVTGEIIRIEMTDYDPLLQANHFLKKALQFSGEAVTDPILLELIADLNAWMGNWQESIQDYRVLVKEQPNHASLRNKLIEQLLMAKYFVEAASQLDSLQQRQQATSTQVLQLANFYMMGKKEASALSILNNFSPNSEKEQRQLSNHFAKYHMLKNEHKKALPYLNSIVFTSNTNDEELYEQEQHKLMNMYTKARIWALVGDERKAIETLKISIDSGFIYQYVLNTDPAWDKMRATKKWGKLMMGYEFENKNEALAFDTETINYFTVLYRIPILNNRFTYH